jgi:hypothetical protein
MKRLKNGRLKEMKKPMLRFGMTLGTFSGGNHHHLDQRGSLRKKEFLPA